jgi:hypothetical protein
MPKAKTPRHFTCRGCDERFPTSDGLDEHLQSKHKSAMYSCTAVGCFKGTSARKFQKSETLTQHIKESHKSDTVFSCVIKTCSFEPSELDDLAIHAHWMHTDLPSELDARELQRPDHDASVDAVINAATWNYFRCPIWNCRKFVSGGYKKVSAHLLAHLPVELEIVQDRLAIDGYEIYRDVIHTASVQIKCPACDVRCEDDTKFKHHLETAHILARSPGTLEHFEQWTKDVLSWGPKRYAERVSRRPCWLNRIPVHKYGWPSRFIHVDRDHKKSYKCSHLMCSYSWKGVRESHPSFLRPVGEIVATLSPHRIQILRHHPDFITSPIFQEQHSEFDAC